MANTKSAAKRARQTETRTLRNSATLSAIKNQTKRFKAVIATGKKEDAEKAYNDISSKLDRAVKTGTIHKNSANRRKSVFAKTVAKIGA